MQQRETHFIISYNLFILSENYTYFHNRISHTKKSVLFFSISLFENEINPNSYRTDSSFQVFI